MKYKFLSKEAIADVCFQAYGKNLNEVFENSALALQEVQVNTKTVKPKTKKIIKKTAADEQKLLYDFLDELIYLKDTKQMLFSKFKIAVKDNKLTAMAYGEKINPAHQLRADIKAVTLHMFELKKDEKGWKAKVVLDI